MSNAMSDVRRDAAGDWSRRRHHTGAMEPAGDEKKSLSTWEYLIGFFQGSTSV